MLVLVHTEELVKQSLEKLRYFNRGIRIGIEKADQEASRGDGIVIGSVATLGRKSSCRLAPYHPADFGVIVCDEAHHAVADSYVRVFEHFGLLESANRLLLFGVTATPYRRDGDQLRSVFQESVFHMPISSAIEQGWLCDLRAYRVRSSVSLDQVEVNSIDFNIKQLENAVNTSARNDLVVRSWYQHAGRRQTIVFCVDIQHANDLASTFRREGVSAEAVWGVDPNRSAKIKRHKDGEIKVLINCSVLTEG